MVLLYDDDDEEEIIKLNQYRKNKIHNSESVSTFCVYVFQVYFINHNPFLNSHDSRSETLQLDNSLHGSRLYFKSLQLFIC